MSPWGSIEETGQVLLGQDEIYQEGNQEEEVPLQLQKPSIQYS